jgi:hypothetical protein
MYAHKYDILRWVNILVSYVERRISIKINVGAGVGGSGSDKTNEVLRLETSRAEVGLGA